MANAINFSSESLLLHYLRNCLYMQVTILDPHDPAVADKIAPRFVQSLPEESIVMENYSHELQTGVAGEICIINLL